MVDYSTYVGLDVHKKTISVAVALPGRGEAVYRGEIGNQRLSLRRLIRQLSLDGEILSFCYEAGPCGYGVYREIVATGHDCAVVAPNLLPRKSGDRVKTDRRDALNLARLHRAGELRAVWVPDGEQEAMRDPISRTKSRKSAPSVTQAERGPGQALIRVPTEHASGWTASTPRPPPLHGITAEGTRCRNGTWRSSASSELVAMMEVRVSLPLHA